MSQKNQKRRKMQQEIYKSLKTQEEKDQFIQARKDRSLERYQKIKAKAELKKSQKKAGLENIRTDLSHEFQDLIIFEGNVCGVPVTACATLMTTDTGIAYRFAYALCSHKDHCAFKTGLSLVGWRIYNDHPYTFTIALSSKGALLPDTLAAHVRVHIEMDMLSRRVNVTERMYRAAVSGMYSSHMGHVIDLPQRLRIDRVQCGNNMTSVH